MSKSCIVAALWCVVLWSASASAGVRLNEIYRNPEDRFTNDDGVGREFFELISTTGAVESLAGITFVEINGQDFPDTGTITQAIDLSSFSTGSNGLFLWRDTSDVLLPAPEPQTVVNVSLFTPHLADDNVTYALVRGFASAVGTDLDLDDDGSLDLQPWASVEDAVGVQEAGEPGFAYANQLGGFDFAGTAFGPDAFARDQGTGLWFVFDSGSGEDDPNYFGPFYANDPGDNLLQNGQTFPFGPMSTDFPLTPGSTNSVVPEPAIALWCGGLVLALFRRARRGF